MTRVSVASLLSHSCHLGGVHTNRETKPYLKTSQHQTAEDTAMDVVPLSGLWWRSCRSLKAVYKVEEHLKLQERIRNGREQRKRKEGLAEQ